MKPALYLHITLQSWRLPYTEIGIAARPFDEYNRRHRRAHSALNSQERLALALFRERNGDLYDESSSRRPGGDFAKLSHELGVDGLMLERIFLRLARRGLVRLYKPYEIITREDYLPPAAKLAVSTVGVVPQPFGGVGAA